MQIALLGAESTGKSTLAEALAGHYQALGRDAVAVPELLRTWCETEGRAPRPDELFGIAQAHEAQVDAARRTAGMVIADTSALMVAIYGAMLYTDSAIYRFAIDRQRAYDITLVTGLDLPWSPDGLQRAGAHVREPVDALVRRHLQDAGVPYRVVYGSGDDRLANALAAIQGLRPGLSQRPWTWNCQKCSDPDCEHRLFRSISRPLVGDS